MSLSFIVPVRNDARRLSRCLVSIIAAHGPHGRPEIIVCDNGSTDDTRQVAQRAGATVLELPGLRVSELRNSAARHATSDCLAFIDADHEIATGWIEAAKSVFRDSRVGAVGALYTSPPAGTRIQQAYGALRGETRGQHDVDWLGSGNLAVRRQAFEQVRGFDTSLEACEDVDLCKRLRGQGWRIVADERLKSIHLGDPPTLSALFRAERWRGRNNIKVSLRPPVHIADLPSLIIPILVLASLGLLAVSVGLAIAGKSLWLAALAVAMLGGVTILKTLRAGSRAGIRKPSAWLSLSGVVVTYEVARALALVSRAGHHRR